MYDMLRKANPCSTTEEGGLGITKLSQVMKSLRMQSACNVQNSDSLWTRLMRAKHGEMAFDSSLVRGTARWKRLQHAWLELKDHVFWSIGEGKLSFWDYC